MAPTLKRPASRIKPMVPVPVRKKSSSGLWVVLLLLLGLGGGGYLFYAHHQEQAEQARLAAEMAARQKAEREAEARRRAEEARRQREAAAEAERLRLAAEEAERKRREAEEAERLRREAEEAERLRRLKEQEPDEPEPTPEPTPEPVKPVSIYDQPVELIGSAGNNKENRARYDAMIQQMFEKGEFELFAAAFAEKIKACSPELMRDERMSHSTYKNSKLLVQALDLCLLIEMATPSSMQELAAMSAPPVESKGAPVDGRQFILWALNDKEQPLHNFLRTFKLNEGKPENMGYAIKTFFTLWSRTPEKMRGKYLNLAIASALLDPGIASSPGMVRNPGKPLLTVPEVYDYFREMDGRKKLATDIKQLSASDLLYVVDVRLPRSEFDWVQENMNYSQARWGEAYASIRYLMTRATNNHDPYTHYTFAELRKEGGVCRDQGYFAHTTARCKGIPAVYIVGDGDRGGHAWIATLINDVNWQQTGSYGYNTGRFRNPCSGRSHHESLLLKRDKKTTDAKLAPAADGMIVSDYLSRIHCTAEARAAAKYVTSSFSTLTAAWGNRLAVLTMDEENLPDEDMWKELNRELTRAGRHNPELMDFAAEIQSGHLLAGKSAGAQKQAMNRNLRKMQRDLDGERSDLLMEAVERQAKVLVEASDIRGLSMLYKKQLKDNTHRGDIFLNLLGAYMQHLEELDASPRAWATMAKDADSIASKKVITNTGDHFKLTKEVAIQKKIAEAYRKAGNTRKADKMAEEADARLQSSKDRYKPEE